MGAPLCWPVFGVLKMDPSPSRVTDRPERMPWGRPVPIPAWAASQATQGREHGGGPPHGGGGDSCPRSSAAQGRGFQDEEVAGASGRSGLGLTVRLR